MVLTKAIYSVVMTFHRLEFPANVPVSEDVLAYRFYYAVYP